MKRRARVSRGPSGRARVILSLAALAFVAGSATAQAPGDREGLRSGPRAKRDHEIRWREWSPAAFDEAKRLKRLVLLDLTAVWCHWCHVMDETTYSDPDVIRILNDEFVPIRVDADRHPEVQDRYIAGGWPTTSILTSDGHVLAAQTYVPPAQLKKLLADVQDLYRKNRVKLESKLAETRAEVRATWKSEPVDSASLIRGKELVDRAIAALSQTEDKEHGGFGGPPRFHDADAVSLLLRVASMRREPELRARAARAVEGLLKLQDTVWGGFYRYATEGDWSRPHYEKMLEGNARAIQSCLEANRATGDRRFLDATGKALRYVNRWLWDERRGGYFGSQDADVGSHEPAKPFTAGEDFYIQGDQFRRKLGAPYVDSTFYADANAQMASTILRGVISTAWDEPTAKRPLRALDRLWLKQRAPDGSLYHAWADGRGLGLGLLADQVLAGVAYLDAYELTGDSRHLDRARSLAEWIRGHLEDRIAGGFRYSALDSFATGRLLAGDKPERRNVDAVGLFLRLYWLEDRPEDLATARRTFAWLRSVGMAADPARALLSLRMDATPVRIAVVGEPKSTAVRALARAAFRAEAPEKVIRFYAKGGRTARWGEVQFPAAPVTALYLCGERVCAPPITDPDRVDAQVRAFLTTGLR